MPQTPGGSGVVADPQGFTLRSPEGVTYRVDIDHGVLSPGNPLLASYLADRQVIAFTGPTVDSLYGSALRAYLRAWLAPGSWSTHVIRTGEQHKSLATVEQICAVASERRLGRNGVMLSVGGGVTCDVVGFAAAMFCRGVRHAKVNTTLVGQVDVGVGVKTGVNAYGSKNALGAYHPPHGSLNDPVFLSTLPPRQIRSGLGEIVKMAVIGDRELFETLEQEPGIFIRATGHDREDYVLRRSMELMLQELCPNLHEVDLARLVDFGHTFGPAIETGSGYRIAHGESVAIDMAISSHLARRLGLIDESTCDRIVGLLHALGLPVLDSGTCRPELLREAMRSARSRRGGRLHLVLPSGIGSAVFSDDVPDGVLVEALRALAGAERQAIGAGRR
ncbi:sedoheptulose 7-phosphate cyclase [Nonomuraea sp. NPDC050153]|uniref:sedoheptulose 7-phosphate cyclase n=1 Tax=Nonomuraea sp. NPDC050153 TaxID=3364359 RepID=UPI0037968DDA